MEIREKIELAISELVSFKYMKDALSHLKFRCVTDSSHSLYAFYVRCSSDSLFMTAKSIETLLCKHSGFSLLLTSLR